MMSHGSKDEISVQESPYCIHKCFLCKWLFQEASSGKSVGDGERHRVASMRNRRNFLQVESNDFC